VISDQPTGIGTGEKIFDADGNLIYSADNDLGYDEEEENNNPNGEDFDPNEWEWEDEEGNRFSVAEEVRDRPSVVMAHPFRFSSSSFFHS